MPRSAGVVQPGTRFARDNTIIATRDVEKARALLAEAGAEGLTLNLVSLTDGTSLAIAQIVQASLAEAGFTVEIQPTDEAACWELGDKTAGDDFLSLELVLMNFAGGIDPTENLVWFRPDQIGVYNWSFFESPEYEVLFQKSLTEQDETARAAMFNRMEDLDGAIGWLHLHLFRAAGRDPLQQSDSGDPGRWPPPPGAVSVGLTHGPGPRIQPPEQRGSPGSAGGGRFARHDAGRHPAPPARAFIALVDGLGSATLH